MQKSVLLEIIRSLDKKEIRELNKWLQSPAHNQRQDVVKLFEFLVKNLPNGDESTEKTRAWKYVFPGKPFDDAYLRQVMYFLLKAIEDYLVFEEFSKDKVQYQLSLSRIYRERKLEKAYRQAFRIGKENLEDQPLRDNYYLFNRFLFEKDYSQLVIKNAAANLQETSDALEYWFISEKLHLALAMEAHRAVYKTAAYNEGIFEKVLEYTQKNNLLHVPAIAAKYYAYMTMIHPGEAFYFDDFENIVLHSAPGTFKRSEMLDLYRIALNYCTAKVNQGNLEYSRRALNFYKSGVETGILLENNVITRYTFGNAVAFALKIGDFEWAEQFIQTFQHYLEEKERNSIVNFNQSRVYFEKGDYKQAQQLLTQFDYDDMLFNPIAKTMLLKIYFETDEYDAFESLLESLRTYLQRKEAMDATRKASYKNMISLMKKLLQLNIFSKAQRDAFRELVAKTNPLAERDWFLRQLDRK
jgi:hypothetical protein